MTANKIAAGAVTADKIAAGQITASKLNVTDVQAAVVTAAAINALNINAANITGGSIAGVTLTGATIRTAVSGRRLELVNAPADAMKLWSAVPGEQELGYVGTATWGTMGMVYIRSPRLSGSYVSPYIFMGQDIDSRYQAQMEIYGDGVQLNLGGNGLGYVEGLLNVSAGTVAISGNLSVAGSIKPATDWVSGTSEDGVWIQDMNVTSRRYKLYYDSSNGRLYVRYSSAAGGYSFFARAGGSG